MDVELDAAASAAAASFNLIFVLLLVATLLVAVPVGIFLGRRRKRRLAAALPDGFDDYAPFDRPVGKLGARVMMATAALFVLDVLGVVVAASRGKPNGLYFLLALAAIPLSALGMLLNLMAVRCPSCRRTLEEFDAHDENSGIYRHYQFCCACRLGHSTAHKPD